MFQVVSVYDVASGVRLSAGLHHRDVKSIPLHVLHDVATVDADIGAVL